MTKKKKKHNTKQETTKKEWEVWCVFRNEFRFKLDMYRVDRNNFFKKPKNSTIYTPEEVSDFLFNILEKHIAKNKIIFDPCVGKGSLLIPWEKKKYKTICIDIKDQGFKGTIVRDYLALRKGEIEKQTNLKNKIGLIIMNPPFNISVESKKLLLQNNFGKRPLLPEVWLKKAIELFGKETPMVLFTPYGFRLNITKKSKRYEKFISQNYPEITSIVSLPKDVFGKQGIIFHCEILFFNLPKLNAHYFLH